MAQQRIVFEYPHQFFVGNERTNGHAASHSFGAYEDVWDDVKLFECPEGTRSPKSCLNLVQDQ